MTTSAGGDSGERGAFDAIVAKSYADTPNWAIKLAWAIVVELRQARAAHQAPQAAYDAGWREAANWAEREDLLADMDSPAYIAARDKFLNQTEGVDQGQPTTGPHAVRYPEAGRVPSNSPAAPQAVNNQEIDRFLERLEAGELTAYLHLIWQRCWWLFDTAAPMKNRVGAQSAINELSAYAERLKAAPQSGGKDADALLRDAERYRWLRSSKDCMDALQAIDLTMDVTPEALDYLIDDAIDAYLGQSNRNTDCECGLNQGCDPSNCPLNY